MPFNHFCDTTSNTVIMSGDQITLPVGDGIVRSKPAKTGILQTTICETELNSFIEILPESLTCYDRLDIITARLVQLESAANQINNKLKLLKIAYTRRMPLTPEGYARIDLKINKITERYHLNKQLLESWLQKTEDDIRVNSLVDRYVNDEDSEETAPESDENDKILVKQANQTSGHNIELGEITSNFGHTTERDRQRRINRHPDSNLLGAGPGLYLANENPGISSIKVIKTVNKTLSKKERYISLVLRNPGVDKDLLWDVIENDCLNTENETGCVSDEFAVDNEEDNQSETSDYPEENDTEQYFDKDIEEDAKEVLAEYYERYPDVYSDEEDTGRYSEENREDWETDEVSDEFADPENSEQDSDEESENCYNRSEEEDDEYAEEPAHSETGSLEDEYDGDNDEPDSDYDNETEEESETENVYINSTHFVNAGSEETKRLPQRETIVVEDVEDIRNPDDLFGIIEDSSDESETDSDCFEIVEESDNEPGIDFENNDTETSIIDENNQNKPEGGTQKKTDQKVLNEATESLISYTITTNETGKPGAKHNNTNGSSGPVVTDTTTLQNDITESFANRTSRAHKSTSQPGLNICYNSDGPSQRCRTETLILLNEAARIRATFETTNTGWNQILSLMDKKVYTDIILHENRMIPFAAPDRKIRPLPSNIKSISAFALRAKHIPMGLKAGTYEEGTKKGLAKHPRTATGSMLKPGTLISLAYIKRNPGSNRTIIHTHQNLDIPVSLKRHSGNSGPNRKTPRKKTRRGVKFKNMKHRPNGGSFKDVPTPSRLLLKEGHVMPEPFRPAIDSISLEIFSNLLIYYYSFLYRPKSSVNLR